MEWVLAGSVVLTAYGARLVPGDLDVVPCPASDNLARVADLLDHLGAIPSHASGWTYTLTPAECRRWRPLPAIEDNLDHQFVTSFGLLDIVPRLTGTFDELVAGASPFAPWGIEVLVAAPPLVVERMSEAKRRSRGDAITAVLAAFAGGARPDASQFASRTL